MVCNFPDDEISWFINRIRNIRNRFGLILETYKSNLQNGIPRKIYIWSVEDNSYRGPDRTIETDRTFGSNQRELPRFGRVRTMVSKPVSNR